MLEKAKENHSCRGVKGPEDKELHVFSEMIGSELAIEVKVMSSDGANSILQSQNPLHLKEFSWDMLLNVPAWKCELHKEVVNLFFAPNSSWGSMIDHDEHSYTQPNYGISIAAGNPGVCG